MAGAKPIRAAAILAFGAAASVLLPSCRQDDVDAVALTQGVYVWQRAWRPEVKEAVSRVPADLVNVLPLAAEVRFRGEQRTAEVLSIRWDAESLAAAGRPVEFVVRIGESGAATRWEDWACEEIAELCGRIRSEAESAGLDLSGLQLDYDCPAARLGDYAKLLRFLRADDALAGLSLSFTSLPTWLDSDAEGFRELAESCDSFVLQVHALELPTSAEDPVVVIDPERARDAARKAAKLGAPFRIALPTYASFVVFDEESGRVVDVISEDLDFSRIEPGRVLRLGESPPAEIAALVSEWSGSPPAGCEGLLWYRLPVEGDVLNWPRETWDTVRSGTAPERSLVVEFERRPEGFDQVFLANRGGQPESGFPARIVLSLEGSGRFVAADGGRWYGLEADGASPSAGTTDFVLRPSRHERVPIPVGGRVPVGWVRWTGPAELEGELFPRGGEE